MTLFRHELTREVFLESSSLYCVYSDSEPHEVLGTTMMAVPLCCRNPSFMMSETQKPKPTFSGRLIPLPLYLAASP